MDVLSLSKIRAQVLQQAFPSGEEPIDIAFCMIGDNLTMSPIEVNGDFSPSKKRDISLFYQSFVQEAGTLGAIQ